MIRKIPLQLAILGLFVLILAGMISAVAATNTVPQTRLASRSAAITANTLKPAQCAAITLTSLVVCSATGTCYGTGNADLILDTSAGHTINGSGGNDCILGGGGNDTINGGAGTDVCIGGSGFDTFSNCEPGIQ
jgi:Ca2+-binding RTX toxin-like protein